MRYTFALFYFQELGPSPFDDRSSVAAGGPSDPPPTDRADQWKEVSETPDFVQRMKMPETFENIWPRLNKESICIVVLLWKHQFDRFRMLLENIGPSEVPSPKFYEKVWELK